MFYPLTMWALQIVFMIMIMIKRERRGGRGKWRGRKGRAPKLLLNQGPSETCYATVSLLLKY